jgi:hypothetical protein
VRLRWLPALLLLASAAGAEVYSWVDERGITHITDDPGRVPADGGAGSGQGDALRDLWDSPIDPAAPPVVSGSSSRSDERARRVLQGAVADLARGENARAVAALKSLLREDPGRAEPHWYLARVDRERGRYESAEIHLRAFLAAAGDDLEPQRAEAQRRLAELEDEHRLADPQRGHRPARWASADHAHFRVRYDAELGEASADYAQRVTGYLEEARRDAAGRLGVVPAEPMGVVLYGKAAYLRAHRHRFSFQTVGFFDGRIHVVSAAHPAGELRALLYHEYTHAVFREQTGGDQPFWLNEGLAELAERASQGQEGMTRSERVALKGRIDAERWIPLRRLAPSFSGLDDEDARAAYLEAVAAALWVQGRTTPDARRQLLELLGQGLGDDEALRRVLSLDTEGLDSALQSEILAEFPRTQAKVPPARRPTLESAS